MHRNKLSNKLNVQETDIAINGNVQGTDITINGMYRGQTLQGTPITSESKLNIT